MALAAVGLLAACQETDGLRSARAYRPIPPETLSLIQQKGMTKQAPILFRAFKKEAELEIWKMKSDGHYALLKTYPMCRWSGQLGPKKREGDRQVPEGFYAITPAAMNPNSQFYLSFNVGYPNAYDRAHGRTGSMIMVHGACSSRGCFSMTDEQISEIYALTREAFGGGQQAIQMQSLPFRMNPENLAKHRFDPNMPFWKMIKEGSDHFEVTHQEPKVAVCSRRYVFNSSPVNEGVKLDSRNVCPPLQQDEKIRTAVAAKQSRDNARVAEQIAKGVAPIKLVYADGGQHSKFTHVMMVSRPEALAAAPQEIYIDANGKPVRTPLKVAESVRPASAVTESAQQAAAANPAPAGKPAPVLATSVARSTPSAAQPAQASAFAPVQAAPVPAPADRSLYQRWFGRVTPQEPPQTAPAAVDGPVQSSPVPLPPRRAANPASQGPRADALPALMRGAQPLLPAKLMGYAPVVR